MLPCDYIKRNDNNQPLKIELQKGTWKQIKFKSKIWMWLWGGSKGQGGEGDH